jgi:hypothetical protein
VPIHKELSGRSSKALLSDLNPRPRGTPASCISISAREATDRHVCKLRRLQSSSTVPLGQRFRPLLPILETFKNLQVNVTSTFTFAIDKNALERLEIVKIERRIYRTNIYRMSMWIGRRATSAGCTAKRVQLPTNFDLSSE